MTGGDSERRFCNILRARQYKMAAAARNAAERSRAHVECLAQPIPTSEALARAAQAGDRQALNTLLARHKHEAYRVALRLISSHHDAEEVLQNALERVLKHLRRYDPTRPFKPWFLGIVVNQARTFWRIRKLKTWVFGTEPDAEPTTHIGPHGELRRNELRHALTEALGALPLEQREAFVLKHIEGLSYEEIAEVTGQSTGSLRVRVHRARSAVLAWCRAHDVTFSGAAE